MQYKWGEYSMSADLRIFLGLGSNISDRYQNLKKGTQLLNDHAHIWVIDQSFVYQSPPMYYPDQDDFYNMVIEIETNLNPIQLLDEVKKIEILVGRNPQNEKNMPRTLDIDVLAIGDLLIRSKLLELPHPKISERKFVLKPWNDISPDFQVPNIDKTISELLQITEDLSSINMVIILDKKG